MLEIKLLAVPTSRLSGLLCLTDAVRLVAVTAIRMNKLIHRMVHFIIAQSFSLFYSPVGEVRVGGGGAMTSGASITVSVDPVDSL